jgi:predicted nucleic acid-binding protein
MTVLIDSDILIEVLRGRDDSVVSRWRALASSDAAILCSAVSVAELWAGARPSERTAITALFDTLSCVPVYPATAEQAGTLLRTYAKSHHVELGDALVAATALEANARLWTRNRKHFPMSALTFFA